MCYKDWVDKFSSFDVCLLPTHFSETKNGPVFTHESTAHGKFAVDAPKIKVLMSVKERIINIKSIIYFIKVIAKMQNLYF